MVDIAATIAAEIARHRVVAVVVDSMVYALAGSEGGGFHEPVTAFYDALGLFAPAAVLVVNHITNADAKAGGAGRPYGGAFAHNGPRVIWRLTRDKEVTDAAAITLVCTKANNLPRKPAPFRLRFVPGDSTITVYPFSIAEASPQAAAGVSLSWRLRVALARGARTTAELAEELGADPESVRKALQRGTGRFFTLLDGNRWGIAQR